MTVATEVGSPTIQRRMTLAEYLDYDHDNDRRYELEDWNFDRWLLSVRDFYGRGYDRFSDLPRIEPDRCGYFIGGQGIIRMTIGVCGARDS